MNLLRKLCNFEIQIPLTKTQGHYTIISWQDILLASFMKKNLS